MASDQLKSASSYSQGDTISSSPVPQYPSGSKWRLRTGWTLTVLSGLFLIFDGVGKLLMPAPVVEATTRLGFPANLIPGVGILLLACTLVYLIPRTAILGAILLTGFLGGAVAIQMRAGSPPFENVFPVLFAIMMWGGVYLREARLCTLVPMRRC
jgi:hypothetical protein